MSGRHLGPCQQAVDTDLTPGSSCRYTVDTRRSAAMRTVVKKWGNSAAVRIPSAVIQAADLRLDEAVEIREDSGRIVIEPVRRKKYDLIAPHKAVSRPSGCDLIRNRYGRARVPCAAVVSCKTPTAE